MSSSVWYLSVSKKKIEFKKYSAKQKNNKKTKQKSSKAKKLLLILMFTASLILFSNLISAAAINDTFHINLQTTFTNGTIENGTFVFGFNITESSSASCLGPIVYNHSEQKTTDSRGISSIYLPTTGSGGGDLSTLDFDKQYYLCYYRDGTLKDVSQLGRVPYSFRATDVNLSEITVDSNLNFTDQYNITDVDTGFFSSLGTLVERITNIFAQALNVSGNADIGGNLTVDTNTLFVNSNTGEVGVGTATPSQALDVAGGIQFGDVTSAEAGVIRWTGTEFQAYNGTDWNAFGSSGGGSLWSQTGSDIYFNTGSVGIGTTTPQNLLNVVGDGNITGTLYYGTLDGEANLNVNSSNFWDGLDVPTDLNNKLTLVEANITDLQTYVINNTAGWIANFTNIYSRDWTNVTITESQISDFQSYILASNEGNLNVNSSNSSGWWDNLNSPSDINAADITDDNTYLLVAGDTGTGNFIFNQNLTVGTDVLFVNNNIGRVGIGTSTIQAKLHVKSNDGDTTGAGIFIEQDGTGDAQVTFDAEASIYTIGLDNDDSNKFKFGRGFGWGTREDIIIDTTGRVGINTATPQNTLNVVGDINATGIFYGNGSGLTDVTADNSNTLDNLDSTFFMPLNTSVYGDFDFNGGWQTGGLSIIDGDIYVQTGFFVNISSLNLTHINVNGSILPQVGFDNQFDVGNATQRWRNLYFGGDGVINGSLTVNEGTLFVDSSSGQVGIGTATTEGKVTIADETTPKLVITSLTSGAADPIIELHGNGPISTEGLVITYDNDVGDTYFNNVYNAGNDSFHFQNNGGDLLTIQTDGDVGIGTTTPSAKLHTNTTDNTTIPFQVDGQNAIGSTVTHFYIENSTGNVGIGVVSPTEKLAVGGNINVGSGITTQQNITFNDVTTISRDNTLGTLSLFTNNDDILLLPTNGDVGINTATPQNTLNVLGDGNITGTLYYGTLDGEANLNVNSSNFWDGLDVPTDLNNKLTLVEANITDLQTYIINNTAGWIANFTNIYSNDWTNVSITGSQVSDDGTYLLATGDTATGNYTFDAGTLFVDSSTNRVGIGTISPDANLHVISSANTVATFEGSGSGDYSLIDFINNDPQKWQVGVNVREDFVIRDRTAGTGDGRIVIENGTDATALFIDDANKVGIGITNPSEILDVSGNIRLQGGDRIIKFNDGILEVSGIQQTTSLISVGNTAINVNTTTGDVGIGTTTPQNKLNVLGDANITGTLYYGTLDGEGNLNVNSSNYWDGLDVPTDLNNKLTLVEANITDLQTYIINNTAGWIANFTNIYSNDWTNVSITGSQVSDDGTYLLATGDTATGNYTFDAGTLFVDSSTSRVGIGTTTPGSKLHINVTDNTTIPFQVDGLNATGSSATHFYVENSTGYVGIGTTIPSTLLEIYNLGSTPSIYFNQGARDISWTAGLKLNLGTWDGSTWSEKAYIDGSGNLSVDTNVLFVDAVSNRVGIGTATPQNLLNVLGDANITGTLYYGTLDGEGNLNVNNSNSSDFWDNLDSPSDINAADITDDNTYLLATGDTATGNYTFDTDTFFIDSSNNRIGIGTTSLNDDFTLLPSAAGAGIVIREADDGNDAIQINAGNSGGNLRIYGGTTKRIDLIANGNIYFNSTGNVGVGQTVPTAKLHVDGLNNLTIPFQVDGQNATGSTVTHFYVENSTGYVGIGTTTPSQLLDVNGGVIFRGNLNMSGNNITNIDKITINTFDPVYTIGDARYATYGATFAGGVKEEVTGIVTLNSDYKIDFNNLEIGSDLWLFYQITDFGENMENLQVILTPGFDGKVWYDKNPQEKSLIIHGTHSGEVSYRFTANRFDWRGWSNYYNDNDGWKGLVVPMVK